MAIQHAIRKRGFRKWYERQLLAGHSHLVLLLLCTLALLGAFEAFSQPGAKRALLVVALLIAAGVGVWSLRRYMFLLLRAEVIANQAVCPQCKNYARWQIDEPVPSAARAGLAATADDHADDDGSSEVMTVCCRKCSHRWRISW
ncbi:MAG TPA: hypothetical protein VK570_14705 [Rubrivivax sp.]|jgi:hypothetical protein|nr:hypothetical protein [Rubrivivax sp.]